MHDNKNEPKRFSAKNLAELLKIVDKTVNINFVSGCTSIKELPKNYIVVRDIPELKKFEKWDTSYSIGPELTLSELQMKGEKNLPALLFESIRSIANHTIRNIATLAGNIFSETDGTKHTLYAPLLALDAKLEFTKAKGELRTKSKSVQMMKLEEFDRTDWVLTKIRIPNDEWEVQIFRRIGPSRSITEESASFAFLVDIQDGIIASIRMAFAGKIIIRSIEFENQLTGLKIPISEPLVMEKIEQAEKMFDNACEVQKKEVSEFTKAQFLNLVKFSLEQLI